MPHPRTVLSVPVRVQATVPLRTPHTAALSPLPAARFSRLSSAGRSGSADAAPGPPPAAGGGPNGAHCACTDPQGHGWPGTSPPGDGDPRQNGSFQTPSSATNGGRRPGLPPAFHPCAPRHPGLLRTCAAARHQLHCTATVTSLRFWRTRLSSWSASIHLTLNFEQTDWPAIRK